MTGDIKQAFLQIRIRETDRDALRFHWVNNLRDQKTIVLRYTRAPFGLVQSPFLLGATIEQHLLHSEGGSKCVVEEIRRSIYVDDIVTGAETEGEVRELKTKITDIFLTGGFKLHKLHSNIPELEDQLGECQQEVTFAKQQLGTRLNESKILGLPWDKVHDSIGPAVLSREVKVTKRGLLQTLAAVYDQLGFISPVTLLGKLIFRDACDIKLAWDTPPASRSRTEMDCLGWGAACAYGYTPKSGGVFKANHTH